MMLILLLLRLRYNMRSCAMLAMSSFRGTRFDVPFQTERANSATVGLMMKIKTNNGSYCCEV